VRKRCEGSGKAKEMPGREFRAILREIVNYGEADEGLAPRVGAILDVLVIICVSLPTSFLTIST
jgi:hypothetical protein